MVVDRAAVIAAIEGVAFDGRWYVAPHPNYRDLITDQQAWHDYRRWLVHEAADAAIAALNPAASTLLITDTSEDH